MASPDASDGLQTKTSACSSALKRARQSTGCDAASPPTKLVKNDCVGSCAASRCSDYPEGDDCTSACTAEFDCDEQEVVVRRYCIIYNEDVPDSYFTGEPICQARADVDAVVVTHNAMCASSGVRLVQHPFARGVNEYNVKPDDGEMWCSIPETALEAVYAALEGKVDVIFEECGGAFDDTLDDGDE